MIENVFRVYNEQVIYRRRYVFVYLLLLLLYSFLFLLSVRLFDHCQCRL